MRVELKVALEFATDHESFTESEIATLVHSAERALMDWAGHSENGLCPVTDGYTKNAQAEPLCFRCPYCGTVMSEPETNYDQDGHSRAHYTCPKCKAEVAVIHYPPELPF